MVELKPCTSTSNNSAACRDTRGMRMEEKKTTVLLVCYPQAIGTYVPLSRGLQQLKSKQPRLELPDSLPSSTPFPTHLPTVPSTYRARLGCCRSQTCFISVLPSSKFQLSTAREWWCFALVHLLQLGSLILWLSHCCSSRRVGGSLSCTILRV